MAVVLDDQERISGTIIMGEVTWNMEGKFRLFKGLKNKLIHESEVAEPG